MLRTIKTLLPGLLLMLQSCAYLPKSVAPASQDYVDGQSMRTYALLDRKIKELKELEKSLDSLVERTERNNYFISQLRADNITLSEEFSRQIVSKDNEIHKLNLQIGSLQNVLTHYEGIMDSLMNLNSRQSSIYNQLLAVEAEAGGDPVSIEKRQLLLVQKNLDSLQQSYGKLAKTTKNLYEDLSIVESSIMDIIQFSFQKSSQQIREKNDYLMQHFTEMEQTVQKMQELLDGHDLLIGTQARTIESQQAEIGELLKKVEKITVAQKGFGTRLDTVQGGQTELEKILRDIEKNQRSLGEQIEILRRTSVETDSTGVNQ